MNNTPRVLCFNLSEGSEAALNALCASMGIALISISDAQCAQPLGTLAGLPGGTAPAHTGKLPFDEPMLVLCGMDEPTFDLFLRAFRFSGIPRIDLKAVLTPTNMAWNAVQLRDELCRERDAIQRQRGN